MKSIFFQIKDIIDNICYLLKSFRLSSKGYKYICLRSVSTIFDTVFPIIQMVIPGLIVNELAGNQNIKNIIIYVSIISISPILIHIKKLTIDLYTNKLSQDLIRLFDIDLQTYIADMEYSSLESPEIAVQTSRILNGAPAAPIDMCNMLFDFARALLGIISVATIIALLNPAIIGILIFFVFINFVINKKISKIGYTYGVDRSKINNVLWKEFDNLSNPNNGKELRLYDLKNFFINRYFLIGCKLDYLAFQKDKRVAILQIYTAITNMLQKALLYIFPIFEVLFNNLPVGSMTIFMSAGNKFSKSLSEISSTSLKISNYCLHIKEIKDFKSMPLMQNNSGNLIPTFNSNSTIEFKNVSFKYPGSSNYALHNLNLCFSNNEKLCIVGKNGSGKSTFIKLLTGLYYPTEGEILLNGVNIKQFNRRLYMNLFAPVFQDYSKYALPLSQNVALEENYNADKIRGVLDKCELKSLVAKLSKGIETYVGKQIDKTGFEPSGGEGQKIAIARAIYHDRPIYLLDEPTAALDPNSEYEIYSTFNKIIDNHAAILVTHRMSAVQLADKIVVFDQGSVAEYGTHKDLYTKGGIYTEMFDKQAHFYRNQPHT